MVLGFAQWFAISLAAIAIACVMFRFRSPLSRMISKMCLWPRFLLVRWISSLVLIRRRWWCSQSITMFQLLLFITYLAGNGLYIGLQSQGNFAVIARRCGIMSSINMIPLFMAGRPSLLVYPLGLPLHVHLLLHHWIGRVSILQALLHLVFVFVFRIERKQSTVSGIVTAALLGCIFFTSFFPFRTYWFEVFIKFHHLIAVFSIGALLWHVIIAEAVDPMRLAFPLASVFVWMIGFIPFLRNLRIRSGDVEMKKYYRVPFGQQTYREIDLIRIDITLTHADVVEPGQYVYLRVWDFYLSDKVQTHPFMICWWRPAHNRDQANKGEMPQTHKLTLLVQPVNGLTRRLGSKGFLHRVSFDGPYGQNLHLEKYDNVFLAVKGIGITGILSYAKHLVELESSLPGKRRITPRKVDIYWELDDNSQENWAGPFLKELQQANDALIDPLLQLWCYFPSEKTSPPCIELCYDDGTPRADFQYFYPSSKHYLKLGDAVSIVAAGSEGRSIVVACGISSFVSEVRAITLRTMSPTGRLDFVETEYRPHNESSSDKPNSSRKNPIISGPLASPITTTKRNAKRVTFI